MVGGAGQELCFYTAQQLSWDTILCCLLERDSTSAGDGGGNLHSLSSLFSLCNSDVKCKENVFPKRWESWIMVLFVPCMPSFVLFSHSTMSAGFGSWEKSCYMYRIPLFFTFQVTLNEWFVVLSEYFRISSFKNAFSPGRKQEAMLTKASPHTWMNSVEQM